MYGNTDTNATGAKRKLSNSGDERPTKINFNQIFEKTDESIRKTKIICTIG